MNSRAFTLVELVVTIGVILVLAGLTLSVSVAIVHGSEVRQTEMTLRLLDQAVREWETQADRQLTYGIYFADDIQQLPGHHNAGAGDLEKLTSDVITIISRSDAIRKILGQIDPDAFFPADDPDPFGRKFRILDAWGNGIATVMPGKTWDASDTGEPDDDGTVRTDIEFNCGVAPNRQICFVSAGPDGELGQLVAADDSPEFEQTKDNVYSVTPEPQ